MKMVRKHDRSRNIFIIHEQSVYPKQGVNGKNEASTHHGVKKQFLWQRLDCSLLWFYYELTRVNRVQSNVKHGYLTEIWFSLPLFCMCEYGLLMYYAVIWPNLFKFIQTERLPGSKECPPIRATEHFFRARVSVKETKLGCILIIDYLDPIFTSLS